MKKENMEKMVKSTARRFLEDLHITRQFAVRGGVATGDEFDRIVCDVYSELKDKYDNMSEAEFDTAANTMMLKLCMRAR